MNPPLPQIVKGETGSEAVVPIDSVGSTIISESKMSLPQNEWPESGFPLEPNSLQGRFAMLVNENPWQPADRYPFLYVDIVTLDDAQARNKKGRDVGRVFEQCVGIVTHDDEGRPYGGQGYAALKEVRSRGAYMEIMDMYIMRSVARNDVSGVPSLLSSLQEASEDDRFTRAFLLKYFGEESVRSEESDILYRDFLMSGLDATQQVQLLDMIDSSLAEGDLASEIETFSNEVEAIEDAAAKRAFVEKKHVDVERDARKRLYGMQEWSKEKRASLQVVEA